MSSVQQIFRDMPSKYLPGRVTSEQSFYFSVGDDKYTVVMAPEECTVEEGKTRDNCDVVLKVTPELFEKIVLKGKMPGALDVATGKIKTNDPVALKALRELFRF